MIPYFAGRAETLWAQLGSRTADQDYGEVLERMTKPLMDYFRMFYGDTVLGGSASALRCGLDFFGPDHVLFASDCPFDPEGGAMFIREGIRSIADLKLPPRSKNGSTAAMPPCFWLPEDSDVIFGAARSHAKTTYPSRTSPMPISVFVKSSLAAAAVACVAATAIAAEPSGTPQNRTTPPVNSGANPYRVIRDWAQFTKEAAMGRLQWRCDRSGRQNRVGDRPLLGRHDAGLPRHKRQSGPSFR